MVNRYIHLSIRSIDISISILLVFNPHFVLRKLRKSREIHSVLKSLYTHLQMLKRLSLHHGCKAFILA